MTAITFDNLIFDEPEKTKSKLTYFFICSLIFHLIVAAYLYSNGWSNRPTNVPQNEFTVQIEFKPNENQRPPTPKPIKQQEIVPTPVEPIIKPSDSHKPEVTQSPAAPQANEAELNSTQIEPIKPKEETQETASQSQNKTHQPTASMNFESIRQSISRHEMQEAIRANEETQSGAYFNPAISQYLSAQEKEQSRLKALNAEKQRQQDNEHFEFNTTGDTSVARIDGRCFLVPQNTSMELEFRIWLPLGDCEKKKKLDFSTKKLDKEFTDGKRGY